MAPRRVRRSLEDRREPRRRNASPRYGLASREAPTSSPAIPSAGSSPMRWQASCEQRGRIIGWLGLLDCGEPSELRRRRESAPAQCAPHRGHLLRRITISFEVRLHRRFVRLPPDQFDLDGVKAITRRHTVVGHDAPLDVFLSDRSSPPYTDAREGGSRLHKGVLRVHSVPGDHTSIIEVPQLAMVADVLSESMQQDPWPQARRPDMNGDLAAVPSEGRGPRMDRPARRRGGRPAG